jgi:mannosyltransferase OCH1-like enzyme
MPEKIKACLDSWKKCLFDWEFICWDRSKFNIDSVLWVKQAYECKKYAFASDYIRFYALYYYGGVYLDSDVFLKGNLNNFIIEKCFLGFEYIQLPEAAVMGAEKGMEWIRKCLDYYNNNFFVREDGSYKEEPVPYLIRLVLKKHFNLKLWDNSRVKSFDGIKIYPFDYFSPKNYFTDKIEETENTVAIHNFANSWTDKKRNKLKVLIHIAFIGIFGKYIHDIIFYLRREWNTTFNKEKI